MASPQSASDGPVPAGGRAGAGDRAKATRTIAPRLAERPGADVPRDLAVFALPAPNPRPLRTVHVPGRPDEEPG